MGRAGSPAKSSTPPPFPLVLAIEESGDAESVVADATDGAPWQEVVVIVCHALPPVMLIAAWTLLVGECLGCVEKETNLRRRYCVNASRPTRLDIIAVIGLAVGGAFGLAGTFVAQPAVRQVLSGHRRRGPSRGDRLVDAEVFPQGRRLPSSGFPGIRQVLMDVGRSIRTTR